MSNTEAAGSVRVGIAQFGSGVFAMRSFRARQTIGKIEGQRFDDPDYGSDYCMGLGEASLEPDPPFRFLNHHCLPNCELWEIEYEEEDGEAVFELWLKALRTIQPGDELTIDYSWPAEAAIPCGCGAPACRGWIVAAEELDQVRRPKSQPLHTRRSHRGQALAGLAGSGE